MKTLRLYKGFLKVKTQKTGPCYLMYCSINGLQTPLINMVFLLEVRIKSMSEEEFSVLVQIKTADIYLLLFGLSYLSEY